MVAHGLLEAEEGERAVDLEAGQGEEQDQRGLRPVPEALEALVDVLAPHRCALLSVALAPEITTRAPACSTTPASDEHEREPAEAVDPAVRSRPGR